MATILLFHHAHGLTPGVLAFAEALRGAGHEVFTPDLYEGRIFDDLQEGVTFAEQTGFGEIIRRGRMAAQGLSPAIVLAGFSLGALPAQALAQTWAGARGALLVHGGEPASEFSAGWPLGLPLEVHTSEGDPWMDMQRIRELVAAAETVAATRLFLYPGKAHLFADPGSGEYEAVQAALLMSRTLDFLARIDSAAG